MTLVLHGRQPVSFRRLKKCRAGSRNECCTTRAEWIFSGLFGMLVMLLISPTGVKAVTWLYLTRHGQTEWNVENRFQGGTDSPLTEKGIRQAEYLAKRLRGISFESIYSSPAGRALRTAEILPRRSGCGDPGASGSSGDGAGRLGGDAVRGDRRAVSGGIRPVLEKAASISPEKGESYLDVQRRAVSLIGKSCDPTPGGTF